jgi:hypothetical protein
MPWRGLPPILRKIGSPVVELQEGDVTAIDDHVSLRVFRYKKVATTQGVEGKEIPS